MTPNETIPMPDKGCRQHFEISQELGRCYTQLGDYKQAKACYEKAAILDPCDPRPYLGTGETALRQGRLEDAEIAFRVALHLDPQNASAFAGQAGIARRRGQLQASFILYVSCLDLDCDDLAILTDFCELSLQLNTCERVKHYLAVYLDRHPGEVHAMTCLAEVHMTEGDYAQARTLLLDALTLAPGHVKAQRLLHRIHRLTD